MNKKRPPVLLTLLIFFRSLSSCGKPALVPKKEIDRYLEMHNIPDTALHIVARMNDLEAIRKSVAGGLGISILSACSAKDLADTHQILMFPLNHETAMRTFYIAYSKNRILKPHVKQFLKFVKGFYQ